MVTGAVDGHLDQAKHIVPGLGDFGDRWRLPQATYSGTTEPTESVGSVWH